MVVDVDKVPFSAGAQFYAVKEGWNGVWYDTNADYGLVSKVKLLRGPAGEATATLPMRPKVGGFEGQMRIELLRGRTLKVSVDAKLTTAPGGLIEHKLMAPYGGWIAGVNWSGTVKGAAAKGQLPAVPKSEKLGESKIITGFSDLTLDARGGPVRITTTGDLPMTLVDYRRNQYANDLPIYWLGTLENRVEAGRPISYSATFQFPPAPKPASVAPAATAGPATQGGDVLAADAPADRVIPTPKKAKWDNRENDFAVTGGTTLAFDDQPGVSAAADELAAFARTEFGVALKAVPAAEATDKNTIRLALGAKMPEEGYRVRVAGNGVRLDAETSAGLLNAARTLRQLFRERDGRVFLRACSIEDWPSLPYRGIHMFTGLNSRDFQVRMMRDILGPLKINQLVYQCEYLRWNSHPELWNPQRGMEQADARAVLDEAARQGIEVTPLINSFGHSNWLFNDGVYNRLADNPDNPNSYDPANPEVFRIVGDVYEEAIRFFRPRVFHIGHDEVSMYGFPESEHNRKVGMTELLNRDVEYWHKFLTERGLRTMLWSDQYLSKTEASSAAFAENTTESKARRARLPKDVIVADWHYTPFPVSNYKSIALWVKEGFDAVACPWDKPANITRFTKATAMEREKGGRAKGRGEALGVMQTTWAGFNNNEESFLANQLQLAAYLLAAESAWVGGYREPSQVPFDYVAEFARLWRQRALPRSGAPGWTADLGPAANLDLGAPETAKWLGYNNAAPLKALPTGTTRMGRFTVRVAGEGASPKAVLLGGRFNPADRAWPAKVTLPVDAEAAAISFAVAASTDGPPSSPIANTVVRYADGTSATVPWKIGQNVFVVDEQRGSVMAGKIWESAPKGERPFALHAYLWENPAPKKRIREIDFVSTNQGPALMVFGVTGVAPGN